MRQCKIWFEGLAGSPYSQSGFLDETQKLDREKAGDFDERVWREHCTTDKDGVCIPAMALKQCLDTSAFKLGIKVDGRRGATYKSFFTSGFFCDHDVPLYRGTHRLIKDDAEMIAIWANSKGIRGATGGSRVKRRYPYFAVWNAMAEFTIVDDILTPQVFEDHFRAAGMIVGIGRFRPEMGGTNGRFRLLKAEWVELQLPVAA